MLWVARSVSFLGDSLGLVALLLYVEGATGAALAVALLLLAGDFTPGLFGAFAGAIGDRFDLKRVMVSCDLVQGALVVVMAVVLPPLPVLLVLVAVRSITAQVFQASSRSAVPALVNDEELEAANSALGAGTNGLEAVGPLIAAALFLITDVRGILLIDAATFFVSAVLLSRLPKMPSRAVGPQPPQRCARRPGIHLADEGDSRDRARVLRRGRVQRGRRRRDGVPGQGRVARQ